MLLIFGFRSRAKRMAEGTFFCPKCGADRSYLLEQIRQWFTFFFVPIFPTGRPLGEHVRCTTCNTRFRPEILSTPTSAQLTAGLAAAMRVATVAVVKAGDQHDGSARVAAVAAIMQSGTTDYSDAQLQHDIDAGDVSALPAYLNPLANGLTLQGKENFVATLVEVAKADGPLTADERGVVGGVGAALGLSAAHLEGIMATAGSSTRAGDETP
jgi:hypothetical protein